MIRLPLILTACAGLMLGGCVSLFPKTDPVQLYRFDGPYRDSQAPAARLAVLRGPTGFTRSAAGDRILLVTGSEVAYIKGARWEAPAAVMFDEALSRAFDASPSIRLATRGEPAGAGAVLRVDVTAFESRYLVGGEPNPGALVELRAVITSPTDRGAARTKLIRAEQGATENRVTAIVAAIDAAVEEALQELVSWTAETVAEMEASASAQPTLPRP